MGTTSFNYAYNTNNSKAEALKQVEYEVTQGCDIVAKGKSGSTLFFAVKHNGLVYGLVVKCSFDGVYIQYKEMDEFMGPYHDAKCPAKVMKALSPLEDFADSSFASCVPYAQAWRERQAVKEIPNIDGKCVTFEQGYKFADGVVVKTFYARKILHNRMRFYLTPDFTTRPYALTNWKKNLFTVS